MEVNEPNAKYLSRPKLLLTSAGELPDDWIVQPLGELMRLLNGRAFRPDEWSDTGAPIIRIQNLNNPDADFNFFSGTVDERNIVRPGDLLFAWSGTTGSSFGARVWTGITGVLNQHIFKVIPDLERLSPAYAYRLLLKSQHAIEREAHGFKASFVHVRKSDLVSVSVGYPPTLSEQDMISEALDDADALIDSLEQLLIKKRQIKQGAMQELLTGKRRLPSYASPWITRRIGSIAPLQRGFDLPSRTRRSGEYPVVYSNGVLNFHCEFMVKGPGVVTGRSGTIGAVTFVEQNYWPHNTSLWVTSFNGSDPRFIFYLFQHIGLERFATGSGVPTLNRNDVHAFEVHVPASLGEQSDIAETLSDIDTELTALEARLTKARALKQAMAQALLTGRIRIPLSTQEPTA